jgi:hypothetical protein
MPYNKIRRKRITVQLTFNLKIKAGNALSPAFSVNQLIT